LRTTLSEAFECVYHECYDAADIEVRLFGGPARLARGSTYFHEVDTFRFESMPAPETRGKLSEPDEQLLFQRFNYARMRVADLLCHHQGQRLPFPRIREMLGWLHRVMIARGQIVQANIGLVISMAQKAKLPFNDYDDIISEGNFTLMRSVDRFDCSRGYKFSTYACRAILRGFHRSRQRLSQYHHRFPVEYDSALERGNAPQRRHENDEAYCIERLRTIVQQNDASLDGMERRVLLERFRLDEPDAGQIKTLIQLGVELGVTKERVRQIQNSALRKLRRVMERELRVA
jgi:RNA polymerase primary sigma factor